MNLDANNMEAVVSLIMKELNKLNIEEKKECCNVKNGVFHTVEDAVAAAKKLKENFLIQD